MKTLEEKLKSKTICAIPWISMTNNPNGDIKMCCLQNEAPHGEARVGTINDTSFEQAVQSKIYTDVRKSIINGEYHDACARCKMTEQNGDRSNRQNTLKTWINDPYFIKALDNTDDNGVLDPAHSYFRFWDIRFSSICNFGCRMCSPINSSYMMIERDGNTKNIFKFDNNRFDDLLKNQIQMCKQINFAGGEPILMKEHWRILDRLVELKQFNVELKYSTNASDTSYNNKNIFDYLDKFKNVALACSIDDIKHRAEYLRYGTKWDLEVFPNLKRYNKYFDKLVLSCAVSLYNIFYIKELVKFLNDNFTNVSLNFNMVHYLQFNNAFILPKELKQIMFEKNTDLMNRFKAGEYKNIKELKKLTNVINMPMSEELIRNASNRHRPINRIVMSNRADLINYIETLDIKRNQKFDEVYPELATFIRDERFLTDENY
jgi:pyruvate-formate lyase-activating enzyme